MKKKMMIMLLCAAAGVAVISFADITPGEKPAANAEMAQMRDELNQLKAKVEMLEFRTKSLESTVAQLKQPPHLMPLNSPQGNLLWRQPPSELTPPKIWGEKEVNGWTFYIVPCEQQ
ncbi:MAG TPA: hypothetical protein VGI88_03255, partial [Verrucomicrobiae bacterium]